MVASLKLFGIGVVWLGFGFDLVIVMVIQRARVGVWCVLCIFSLSEFVVARSVVCLQNYGISSLKGGSVYNNLPSRQQAGHYIQANYTSL